MELLGQDGHLAVEIRAVVEKVCSYCRRVFIAWPSLRGPDAPVYCCMGHFTASTRRRRPVLN
jgi:hypothetical protein